MRGRDPDSKNVWGFVITLVIGVGLTLMAIPLVLFAACFPFVAGRPQDAANILVAAAVIAATVPAVVIVLTRNQGVRWGAIALCVLAAAVLTYYLMPRLH